jgi:serine/threonine protein kinase
MLEVKRQLRQGPLLQAGEWLAGRYKLLGVLGSGGFATVWRAFDRQSKQVVALKVLHGQHGASAERLDRFRRGARAMQQLTHPHIVRILGEPCQEDGGYHFFAMEYVGGGTFAEAVSRGVPSAVQRLRIIEEVGDALAFAHKRGIVHRDVTPDNILLTEANGSARLTDFDLVRLEDSTGGTRTGALGKYIYAAPECMESAKDVDQRCDVYSLGMTAVFAYHGKKLPYGALRQWEGFLEELGCPDPVKAVLARATAPEPDKRFATMKEFCAGLTRGAQGEFCAGLTVLVVDDSAMDRDLVRAVLDKMAGCRVTFAANGVEALEVMERQTPDLVLTDIFMPEMDGLQLVLAIRGKHPLVPVILMTGTGNEELAVQALHKGAASYVPKKNLARDLAETLETVLAASRRRAWRHWL